MKDAEDEAFDELAKRQGHWGGGFMAKKAMAADKLQEPDEALTLEALKYAASKGYGRIVRENSAPFTIKEALAQPAQEPPSEWAGIKTILDEYGLQAIDFVADFKAALAPPAQEPVAWWSAKLGVFLLDEKHFDQLQPLYTAPPQRERVVFPTMLRKMWSGGEVQAWLDENVNKENHT